MNIRFFMTAFAVVLTLLLFSGCKEKAPETGVLEITGPQGMTVSVAGKKFDKNPLRLKMRPGKYAFGFEAPGCYPRWRCLEVRVGELQKVSVELEKVLSAVLLDSDPQGAEVHFNGSILGVTPLVISDLEPGSYTADLSKTGYARKQLRWEIRSGRPHPRLAAKLELISGSVLVSTVPAGARVFFNGKDAGVAPCRSSMDAGVYRMRIEYPGCEPFEEEIVVAQGKVLKKEIRLAARPGGVEIASVPAGAGVFMDGRKLGSTPYSNNSIEPGSHMFRIELPGFDTVEKKIDIAPSVTEKIELVLSKSTGSLLAVIRPAGVRYLVDGKEIGMVKKDAAGNVLPVEVGNLSPGKHLLTVTHPLAKPVKKDIAFVIEKNRQFNMRSPIELWVANCELEFRSGKREKGVIYGESDDAVYYSPQPGVKYHVSRANLRSITKISAEESSKIKASEAR